MARKEFPQDEPASPARGGSVRAPAGDLEENGGADPIGARLLDLEPDQESPFLRAPKRVPVRRTLPRKTATRLKFALAAFGTVALLGASFAAIGSYGRSSWRFRLESSDQVQITGNHHVSRAQLMEVFGADISRNVFLIPLGERKRQLEQIPWIESATVMRLLPSRLSVAVRERTPAAFAQVGPRILLIDRQGVLMDYPPAAPERYSFPVILGMNAAEPLSTRAARMRIYDIVMHDLDSSGANYSRGISEVDLSDPQDVKVTADDPQGAVVVHLGSENYLERYKVFVSHIEAWRQQYSRIGSVDVRYEGQVVVSPDLNAAGTAAPVVPSTPGAASRPSAGGASTPKSPSKKHAAPAAKRHGKTPPWVRHKR